jgi:hypothetical protein
MRLLLDSDRSQKGTGCEAGALKAFVVNYFELGKQTHRLRQQLAMQRTQIAAGNGLHDVEALIEQSNPGEAVLKSLGDSFSPQCWLARCSYTKPLIAHRST